MNFHALLRSPTVMTTSPKGGPYDPRTCSCGLKGCVLCSEQLDLFGSMPLESMEKTLGDPTITRRCLAFPIWRGPCWTEVGSSGQCTWVNSRERALNTSPAMLRKRWWIQKIRDWEAGTRSLRV